MKMIRTVIQVGFVACALIGAFQPAKAEKAASVDYDFVERNTTIPSSFTTPPETSLRFLRISTLDHSLVDAALWQPKDSDPAKQTVVVSVHGSGDNFVKPPIGFLSPALAAKG